jgi:hypothetical protein
MVDAGDFQTPDEVRRVRAVTQHHDGMVEMRVPASDRVVFVAPHNISTRLGAGYVPVTYARVELAMRLLFGSGAVRLVNNELGIALRVTAGHGARLTVWHPRYNVTGTDGWVIVRHGKSSDDQVVARPEATPVELVAEIAGLLLDAAENADNDA